MVGSDTLAAQLREARFDDAVKAVVLRIDSPGGSAFASEVIRREVVALREAASRVASMSSVAASGGYWIAMSADRIVASPATLTGSIGIFAVFPTIQRTLERSACTPTAWARRRSPANSGSTADGRHHEGPVPAEPRAHVPGLHRARRRGRKMKVEAVDAVAQGRVWPEPTRSATGSSTSSAASSGDRCGGEAGEAR